MNTNKKNKNFKISKAMHYVERHMDYDKLKEVVYHNDTRNK